jgi:hypothetical protein
MVKENTVQILNEDIPFLYADIDGREREVRSYVLNDGTSIFVDNYEFYFFQNNQLIEPKKVLNYLRKLANYSFVDAIKCFFTPSGMYYGLYMTSNYPPIIPLHKRLGERIALDSLWKEGDGNRNIFFGSQISAREQVEDWNSLEDKDFPKDISKEKTITSARKGIESAKRRLSKNREILALMKSIK